MGKRNGKSKAETEETMNHSNNGADSAPDSGPDFAPDPGSRSSDGNESEVAGELAMLTSAELKQRWIDADDLARQMERALATKSAVEHEIGSRAMREAAGRKGVVIEIAGRQLQPKKLEKRGGGRYQLVEVGQRNVVDF